MKRESNLTDLGKEFTNFYNLETLILYLSYQLFDFLKIIFILILLILKGVMNLIVKPLTLYYLDYKNVKISALCVLI